MTATTASTFGPYRTTYAEYLAVESCSESRHEFIDGVIVAMAGGSDEHNAITSQIGALLHGRTRTGCRMYGSDQRIFIEATEHSRYPDAVIICGPPQHPPHDPQATTNPLVIVEVLSPSTASNEYGPKRLDFQTLPSLQAYVLVAQDRRSVLVFQSHRPETGTRYNDGASIELPGLAAPITVDEIYRGILDESGASLLR